MKQAQGQPKRVLIVQAVCKQYREPLFARMQTELADQGVELRVAYSAPPASHSARNDNVGLPPHYGFEITSLSLAGGKLVWQFPAALVRWADLIIVEHAVKHALNYMLLALSWLGWKKVAYWTHGGTLRHASSALLRPWRRRSLLAADWVFAYTEGVAKAVIAEGVEAARVTALQNAIDLSGFRAALAAATEDKVEEARRAIGISQAAHVALFCGSLYPGRGIDFLLRAGDRIVEADPSFHLILLGAGPLAGELRKGAETRPWLHVMGSTFGDARALYFRMAQVCLMPYLAGLGILDAMAAGLPFIVTGANATNPEIDYLVDGVTGLITGDSVERYADQVAGLFADADRLRWMAQASRVASQQYSIEAMAANFIGGIGACLAYPARHSIHVKPSLTEKLRELQAILFNEAQLDGSIGRGGNRARELVEAETLTQIRNSASTASVAILLTCFNRRAKTLETLKSLEEQRSDIARMTHVILVDDGSRDGTAEAVLAQYPQVELLRGTGSLFWNGGMRMAFARAQEIGFDYYVLLNDDTLLAPHCMDTLLTTAQELEQRGITSIVTASTCDPETGKRTYGGMRRELRWNGVHDIFIEPVADAPVPCDTMNGNCTLIPAAIARRLGNLEKGYRQQFGDFDYGFRATQAGFAVHVAPGYLGRCPNNPVAGTWRDPKLSSLRRWHHLMSPKGVPVSEWFLFSRRHYGYLWPLYFVSPYLKVSLSRFRSS